MFKSIVALIILSISLTASAQETYGLTDHCGGSGDFYTNYIPSNRPGSLRLEKCKATLSQYCDSIFTGVFNYTFEEISGIKARKMRDSLEIYPREDSKHLSIRYQILINEFLIYTMKFILDSNYRVEYAPNHISQGHASALAQIKSFKSFESQVLSANKEFIKSINRCKLKFDDEKQLYYYRVIGPTYGKKLKKTKHSHERKYNFLEVNAITGEVLKKGTDRQFYSSVF